MSSYMGDSPTVNPFISSFTSRGIDATLSQIASELGQLRVFLGNIVTQGPAQFFELRAKNVYDRNNRLASMLEAFGAVYGQTLLTPSQSALAIKNNDLTVMVQAQMDTIQSWTAVPTYKMTAKEYPALAKAYGVPVTSKGPSMATLAAVGVGAIAIWFALK